jgi:hypothetical protein
MKAALHTLSLMCAFLGIASGVAMAQGTTTKATLTGVVQDTSGGALPAATVVIKNVATGVTNETLTNSTGLFSVPALDPGTYEATVSLSGFKTVRVERISLVPGNTASISVTLNLGDLSETVNVIARTELINTTSTTVSATISADQMQQLPLVTRNAMYFVALLPGINSASGTHITRNSTAMGLPGSAIAITIDGINVQDQDARSGDGFYANVRPQTDMVEQVTVSEATATADSSGQGSVQIRFVTRSGTNVNTGSAYEYLRDTSLMTNSFFNEFRNLPKNIINWNQFGIRHGGPIVIPGVFDGRGKAFWFFNFEEFRLAVTAATTRQVLSTEAQAGLFRYGCTAAAGCNGSRNVLDLAAQNGQISTIDPTVAQMFHMINEGVGTQGSIQRNVDLNTFSYSWQPPEFRIERFPFGRVDLNLNESQRLSGTFLIHKINSDPDIVNSGFSSFPDVPVRSTQYSYRQTSTITLRSTFTQNIVNEAGWGNIWAPVYFSSNVTPDLYVGGRNFAFLGVGGTTPSQFNVTAAANSRNGLNYNLHDTLNWLKGSHSFSMGGTFTKVWNWAATQSLVPPATLGLDTTLDPAAGLFTTTNFPGATPADLTSARNLYATLTGRVTAINANATLQADGTYLYRGDTLRRHQQKELGLFFQDQWRLKPNLTLNAGVRYQLQFPVQALESVYATNDLVDFCGRAGLGPAAPNAVLATAGCRVGIPGVPLDGPAPFYKQYIAKTPGYDLDTNNFGPTVGIAWLPNVQDGLLRTILGDPELATLRASWGRSFNAGGLSDYTGTLSNGPGLTVASNRSSQLNNLVLPGDAERYGGNGWPVLLRQPERLGAPPVCPPGQTDGCIPASATFPKPIIFSTGIEIFDPEYQTSYTDSWSVGLQRAIGKDMSVEVRYIQNGNRYGAGNIEYNEQDIFNAGFGSSANFVDEFRKAQQNLAANVAAGRGATFAYTGIPGTSPLPIFLGSYLGLGPSAASDPARYTGNQWTNSATIPSLSQLSSNIFTFASTNGTNGLFGNPTFRANGIQAGMPANFWVMNPDVQSASLRTAENKTKYRTVQILLNRRLTRGLAFSANYAYQEQFNYAFDSIFRERALVRTAGAPPHAFKVTANFEIPVGRGKRYGSDINPWLNGAIGNWNFNFTGRVETGRLIDIGDVKLVNMTIDDLQKMFKYYQNPVDGFYYNLPQEVIANTVKAFAIDATNPTGRPLCTGSNALTCGGPDETKPYIAPAGDASCTRIFAGDCGPRQQLLKAPLFGRFDVSLKKRFPFAGRGSFDFQVDVLNVFNAINFNSVWSTSTNPDNYRVTTAYADINNSYDPGGRIMQLVFRVNW